MNRVLKTVFVILLMLRSAVAAESIGLLKQISVDDRKGLEQALMADPTLAKTPFKKGYTPLLAAINYKKLDALELLLEYGADPNAAVSGKVGSHLEAALVANLNEMVDMLVKAGADTEDLFLRLVQEGKLEQVKLVVNAGHKVSASHPLLISFAAQTGNPEIIEYLIKQGAKVDPKDPLAISIAAKSGFVEMAESLIAQGADANAGVAGFRPVDLATIYVTSVPKGRELVSMFVLAGATPTPVSQLVLGNEEAFIEAFPNKRSVADFFNKYPIPLLNLAVRYGCARAVGHLLGMGISPLHASRTQFSGTALHEAAFYGRNDILAMLLKKTDQVNVIYRFSETPLHFAAAGGNPAAMELLLDKGGDPHVTIASMANQGRAWQPWHFALSGLAKQKGLTDPIFDLPWFETLYSGESEKPQDFIGAVDHLIKAGAHPALTAVTNIELMAFRCGEPELAQRMMESGAVPMNVIFWKEVVTQCDLSFAKKYFQELPEARELPIAKELLLIDFQDDPTRRLKLLQVFADSGVNFSIGAPLAAAMSRRQDAEAKFLLENGADLDASLANERGFAPLHHAVYQDNRDFAEALLLRGAEVNREDNDGNTAIMLLEAGDVSKWFDLFVKYKVDLEHKNESGETPLLWATKWGYIPVVKELANRGADINAADAKGYTVLEWAKEHKKSKALLEALGEK